MFYSWFLLSKHLHFILIGPLKYIYVQQISPAWNEQHHTWNTLDGTSPFRTKALPQFPLEVESTSDNAPQFFRFRNISAWFINIHDLILFTPINLYCMNIHDSVFVISNTMKDNFIFKTSINMTFLNICTKICNKIIRKSFKGLRFCC